MSLKKTDLEKNKASKLMDQMRHPGSQGRFGQAAAPVLDRREQRKLDQAAGLVPFATKLNQDLIKQIQSLAETDGVSIHEMADRLIRAGLASVQETQA